MNTKKKKKKYIFRSAVDGRFVSRIYALLHPLTTIKERADSGD